MVQQLQQGNLDAKPVNNKLDILDVQVSGNTATAHTMEVWTVTYTNKTDKSTRVDGPATLDEIYHLVKQGDAWLISSLDIKDMGAKGTPTS